MRRSERCQGGRWGGCFLLNKGMSMSARTLLVIGFVWPEPKSSAAGTRMMQLITFFLDRDYNITFASTASKTELSEDLALLGINEEPDF